MTEPETDRTPARLPAKLKADCSACCALCCVALPFDAAQGFGFDKRAHTPCALLRSDDRCCIHHQLSTSGFPGCAAYDCYGAGQWVVQHYFNGGSWRTSPDAARMFDAFRRVRALHELMAMLTLSIAGTCESTERRQFRSTLGEIEVLCAGGLEELEGVDIVALRQRVLKLLRELPRLYKVALGKTWTSSSLMLNHKN